PNDGARPLTANITLTAEAHDQDDAIALVEFFNSNTKLGEIAITPYSLVWSNAPFGTHMLTAVATDSHGLSSTSAPVSITAPALVASGADWKYLDDGSDQGVAWREPAFDDSGWTNGPAQLGYGDGDETTVINGGPAS